MRTDLLPASTATQREKAIAYAVKLLRKGEIVALPTETVYGLAADALDPIAVAKIFEAKERPRFDPLIVHLPNREWLERIAHLTSHDREMIFTLADKFWPGPFTMVLPKPEIIPDIVSAGLDTVAVRISAHPVFSDIVGAFGKPLAMPDRPSTDWSRQSLPFKTAESGSCDAVRLQPNSYQNLQTSTPWHRCKKLPARGNCRRTMRLKHRWNWSTLPKTIP